MLNTFPSLLFLLPSFSLAALAQEADSPSPVTRSSSLQDRQFVIEADIPLSSSTVFTDNMAVTSTITSSSPAQPTIKSLDKVRREDYDSANKSILFLPYPTGPPDPNSIASDAADQDSPSLSLSNPSPKPSGSNDPSSISAAQSSDFDASQTPAPAAIAAAPPALKGPLVAAYYPDWESSVVSPESIDFSKFDWIDFAFVTLNKDLSLAFDDSSSPALLSRLVSAAHSQGSKVKISIGGWDGSRYFSTACATASSRKTFASNAVSLYNKYKVDGIDIDWEYPGQQGAGSNVVSPQDSANFLSFLQLLRTSLPGTARITAAVQTVPFAGSDGNPMKDVSGFGSVLDWVTIMNYDTFSSSSNPGPNAPLSDGCHNSSQPQANAMSAVSTWKAAKFPVSKLMLGVPAYGYINPSKATHLQHRALVHLEQLVDHGASSSSAPLATVMSEDGGQVQFRDLLNQAALIPGYINSADGGSSSGVLQYVGYSGFTRLWDNCSSTPFLTSPYETQVITYDDPQSLGLKAAFAQQAGILGVVMWDLTGDTTQWNLTSALRLGLGKS